MKKTLFVLLIIFLLIITGCTKTADKQKQEKKVALQKTAVMLDWSVNTNHTGLYVAKELGYFAQQGLDVEILEMGDPGPSQLIAAGQLDFGISYQEEVTNARALDVPLVSLAAVIQHNTSGFASRAADNIKSPRDLQNKRYGGWGSSMEIAVISALMKQDNVDPKTVKQVDIGAADFFSVIGRDIDFSWIFYGWDGIRAEQEKSPLNIMMLKDYADYLDYYTPIIITNEKNITEKPELIKKFMTATSRGYEYAIDHPREAAEILIKAAPELDKELVYASQEWLSKQYQADAPQWGWQKKEVWERYAQWMNKEGLLSPMIKTEEAFTNVFLPKK